MGWSEVPVLVCKKTVYYSQNDEKAFFDWIGRIKCVASYGGSGDELHLLVRRRKISDTGLRDLIALFFRYSIDLKQLRQFANATNRSWFIDDLNAYWAESIKVT